ncbi:hypothetical protein F5Y16DRAFT_243803 [Xylariaceae sp. FL0255]|nr:hypothetical protein F5Y16DRAFT_243803 [Xylariaceae sp. FL0255]
MRPLNANTLSPLPDVLRQGSIAIVTLAFASFFSALTLFIYLTIKIVLFQIREREETGSGTKGSGRVFTTSEAEYGAPYDIRKLTANEATIRQKKLRKPNQFTVLIVNLLIADLHQATAFLLSSSWVARDGILVGTATCFSQGLFVSIGDLASSCFMSAIAIHTYFSIIKGYRPPQKILYLGIGLIWLFVYALSLVPLAATRNGAHVGGYFARAVAWCWISSAYENLRLATHYIFIFISIFLSWTVYTAIFISLRRQQKRGEPGESKSYHPAFFIYPIVYLVCILPLAAGRIASMAGRTPPFAYFCVAGALTASNGWLDVLVFASTRRAIVFANAERLGDEDTGVNTFAFMNQTPTAFGNSVWIGSGHGEQQRRQRQQNTNGWWRLLGDSDTETRRPSRGRLSKTASQTSLKTDEALKNAIQMEVITSVVVEDSTNTGRNNQDSMSIYRHSPRNE